MFGPKTSSDNKWTLYVCLLFYHRDKAKNLGKIIRLNYRTKLFKLTFYSSWLLKFLPPKEYLEQDTDILGSKVTPNFFDKNLRKECRNCRKLDNMILFFTDRRNKSFVWEKLNISVTWCVNDRQSTSFLNCSTYFGSANTLLSLNNLNGSSMNWRDPGNRNRFTISKTDTQVKKKELRYRWQVLTSRIVQSWIPCFGHFNS